MCYSIDRNISIRNCVKLWDVIRVWELSDAATVPQTQFPATNISRDSHKRKWDAVSISDNTTFDEGSKCFILEKVYASITCNETLKADFPILSVWLQLSDSSKLRSWTNWAFCWTEPLRSVLEYKDQNSWSHMSWCCWKLNELTLIMFCEFDSCQLYSLFGQRSSDI